MEFTTHAHRDADLIFAGRDGLREEWSEILDAVRAVTDAEIIDEFESNPRAAKSISQAINRLLKRELVTRGWHPETFIFADREYAEQAKGVWRLDFSKRHLCIEVAFNHRSDISWNLLKPTLAAELNHVLKAVQAEGGVIVAATEEMKAAGGFDSAVGTFEDYVQYLRPLSQILTAPLMVVGLEAPRTFRIETRADGNRKVGQVVRLGSGYGQKDAGQDR